MYFLPLLHVSAFKAAGFLVTQGEDPPPAGGEEAGQLEVRGFCRSQVTRVLCTKVQLLGTAWVCL